jgi:predicted DNA binding CopG/RHH family protein
MMSQQVEPEVNADGLIVVHSRDQIPTHFASPDAEAEWWETHELDADAFPMRSAAESPRLQRVRAAHELSEPGTTSISIRLETDVLDRLRKLAAARHLGYQTLLKRFVVERLYEEEHLPEGTGGPS